MRVAIIDIGSNAIRAAIYDNNTLGAFEIFNEKFRSDISFMLDQELVNTKHSTYNKFVYFMNIFKKMNVSILACVATEVLRSHPKA
ncbi:MAG: Ppx/GppA family phosphatase, partial [Rickettsiaceae bacterium]|nr:Ppx/GppA family phosphatase [Rickettsiaceae bacterium]